MTVWFEVEPRNGNLMIITTGVLFEGEESVPDDDENVLFDGTKVTKWAKRTKVTRSSGTEATVTLRSDYVPGSQWKDQSVSLNDDEKERSLSNLLEYLIAAKHVETKGRYVVLNASHLNSNDIESVMNIMFEGKEKLKLLPSVMDALVNSESAGQIAQIVSENPEIIRKSIAVLNLERLAQAVEVLRNMVDRNPLEKEFQDFLEINYWMFGSEYSELIPKRSIPYNRNLDFPLRRTADGYLEAIEIKRPGATLFRPFRARKDTEYEFELLRQSPELSEAIAQATDYIFAMDRQQDMISAESRHGIKTDKIRAKVVIGRDSTEDEIIALRRLNALLHGIEVITFDQLIGNAQRILDILSDQRDVGGETAGTEQITASPAAGKPEWADASRKYPDAPASVDDIPF